jgi:hypothetical protein
MKKIIIIGLIAIYMIPVASAGKWRWTSKSKKLKGRGDCVWTVLPPSVECSVSGIATTFNCQDIHGAPASVSADLKKRCLMHKKEKLSSGK